MQEGTSIYFIDIYCAKSLCILEKGMPLSMTAYPSHATIGNTTKTHKNVQKDRLPL